MLEWTSAGEGPRFGMIVHHTDAEREFADDRDSKIGRLVWDVYRDAPAEHCLFRGYTDIPRTLASYGRPAASIAAALPRTPKLSAVCGNCIPKCGSGVYASETQARHDLELLCPSLCTATMMVFVH